MTKEHADYVVNITMKLDADWGADYPHRVDMTWYRNGHVDEELSQTHWFADPAIARAWERSAYQTLATLKQKRDRDMRTLRILHYLELAFRFFVIASFTLAAVAFLFSLGG
jgi:hypothetical protein